MAVTSIKSTYALDVESVRALARMARGWKVSNSEALRRAIRAVASDHPVADDPVVALDAVQQALRLSRAKAAGWVGQVRAERRASAVRVRARPR